MIEAYKFRLYPTKEQKVLLAKHFGCVRFIYNWALDRHVERHARGEKYLGWMSLVSSQEYMKLKREKEWLYEVNAQSLQNAVGHLDKAFQGFFRNHSGFPRRKRKHFDRDSFEVPSRISIDFKAKKIKIPKFTKSKKEGDNRLRFVLSRKVKHGKIGTATVSRNPAGQYFISFIIKTDEAPKEPLGKDLITKENSLGMDFGMKHFITFDDGTVVDSPEYFRKYLSKLAWEQHKLSRKKRKSKNYERQRMKVARVHQHIADQRKDFLHKLTTSLVRDERYQCFCMENLNMKGMSKLWGRKVHDLSWYSFVQMLTYKSARAGKLVRMIGRFDPSSQICSCCGHRQPMPLSVRTYKCPDCGMVMDRDQNAARNIRSFALRDILKNTDGTSGINACGVGSSGCRVLRHDNETADVEAGKSRGRSRNRNRL